ncbi:Uncharacterised protein [Flavonifractor plautii]|jgi:hypothetical protein|nr:Uncharacterised protein [Flavonifractor plautii]
MARAIDADRLKQAIDHDYYEHYTKYHDSDQTALIDMVMDDIDEMPTLTPPNEALTLEDAKKERYIWFTPLNDWAKVTPFGVLFFGSEELMNWETLCEEWGYRFKAYRRPPEVSP